MKDTLDYHLHELNVALDPSHHSHISPPFDPAFRTILDVGCGMGQTLIAAKLPAQVTAYGVDLDSAAIELGNKFAPPNLHLSLGSGEALPFEDSFFDFVICRVALPYMKIESALAEMSRVLKPGGFIWLVLHPIELYWKRARKDLKGGNLKDLLYCGFVVTNGMLFNSAGKQLVLKNRTETFQSRSGMRRALARSGFQSIAVTHDRFLVATAQKTPVAAGLGVSLYVEPDSPTAHLTDEDKILTHVK